MSSPGPCREESGPWSKAPEKGMRGQAPDPWPHSLSWPQTFETLNFYFPLFILYYVDKLYSIHP